MLAESLPQQPVLSEGPQLGAHLAQADQVPAVRQTLHDVQLQTDRQVSQCHACRCGLKETEDGKSQEYYGTLHFLNSQNFSVIRELL